MPLFGNAPTKMFSLFQKPIAFLPSRRPLLSLTTFCNSNERQNEKTKADKQKIIQKNQVVKSDTIEQLSMIYSHPGQPTNKLEIREMLLVAQSRVRVNLKGVIITAEIIILQSLTNNGRLFYFLGCNLCAKDD